MIKKYNVLFILLILWMVSIYSVIYVIVNSYEIGIQNYIGYGLLILITVLKIFRIERFKTTLGVLLIVGSVNAIQFTYATSTLVFTWTPLGHRFSSLGIQPLSVSLLFLLIILNFSGVLKLMVYLFTEDPKLQRTSKMARKPIDEKDN